jgi:flotillin
VRTGLGIADLAIAKTALVLPFQRAWVVSVQPTTFACSVDAMTKEKLQFTLPANFTVGPKEEHGALQLYARYVATQPDRSVQRLVEGIIEGETRSLAADMSIEDIFRVSGDRADAGGHNNGHCGDM